MDKREPQTTGRHRRFRDVGRDRHVYSVGAPSVEDAAVVEVHVAHSGCKGSRPGGFEPKSDGAEPRGELGPALAITLYQQLSPVGRPAERAHDGRVEQLSRKP